MSIWAGIKHALNSTLGTKDFKPLDKIISNDFKNQWSMYASDDIYYPLSNLTGAVYRGESEWFYYPQKFKMNCNGSVRIKGDFFSGLNREGAMAQFAIFKNADFVTYYTISKLEEATVYYDLNFKQGDIISFGLYASLGSSADWTSAYNPRVKNFSLNGTLVNSAFELIQT